MFKAVESNELYKQVVKKGRSSAMRDNVIRLAKNHPVRIYRKVWDNITTVDDKPNTIMVVDNLKLIVPEECRENIFKYRTETSPVWTDTLRAACSSTGRSTRPSFPTCVENTQTTNGCETRSIEAAATGASSKSCWKPMVKSGRESRKSGCKTQRLEAARCGTRKVLSHR